MDLNTFTNANLSINTVVIATEQTEVSPTSKFLQTATSLPVCYSLGGLAVLLILTGILREVTQAFRFNRTKRRSKLSDVELLEKIWKMNPANKIRD